MASVAPTAEDQGSSRGESWLEVPSDLPRWKRVPPPTSRWYKCASAANHSFYVHRLSLKFHDPALEDYYHKAVTVPSKQRMLNTYLLMSLLQNLWAIMSFVWLPVHYASNPFTSIYLIVLSLTATITWFVCFRIFVTGPSFAHNRWMLDVMRSAFFLQWVCVTYTGMLWTTTIPLNDGARFQATALYLLLYVGITFLCTPPFCVHVINSVICTTFFAVSLGHSFRIIEPVCDHGFISLEDVKMERIIYGSSYHGLFYSAIMYPVTIAIVCAAQTWQHEMYLRSAMVINLHSNHMARQLEHARSNQKMLFENMSHDLRDPLNVIVGQAEFLLRSNSEGPALRADDAVALVTAASPPASRTARNGALKSIVQTASHIKNMAEDLLELSKLESDAVPIVISQFSVLPLVLEQMNNLGVTLRAQSSQVTACVYISQRAERVVYGALVRLRQVLTNLMSNATKFNSVAGEVALVVDVVKEGGHSVAFLFQVYDTGSGIAKEDMSKLFNRYAQFSASGSSVGFGLGLAGCRILVSHMRGTVLVDSEEGKGSCFSVMLPFELERINGRGSAWSIETIDKSVFDPQHVVGESGITLGGLRSHWLYPKCAVDMLLESGPSMEDRPLAFVNKLCILVDARPLSSMCLELYLKDFKKIVRYAPTNDDALDTAERLLELSHTNMSSVCFIFTWCDRRSLGEAESIDAGELPVVRAIKANPILFNRVHCVVMVPPMVSVVPDAALDWVSVFHVPLSRSNLSSLFDDPASTSIAEVPRRRNSAPDDDEPTMNADVSRKLAGLTVLIVEDNPVNQALADSILTSVGMTTVLADNGYSAIEKCRSGKIDIVLMDWKLNGDVDGVEAARRIRANEKEFSLPHVHILGVTANAFTHHTDLAMAAGMDDVLLKPYHTEQLLAAMANFVPDLISI